MLCQSPANDPQDRNRVNDKRWLGPGDEPAAFPRSAHPHTPPHPPTRPNPANKVGIEEVNGTCALKNFRSKSNLS